MGRIAGVAPEQTRCRLIEAAVVVFSTKGYEGARVSDITREAGLSSGAIYAHYSSKAELLVDAIRVHGPSDMAKLLADGDVRTPLPDLLQTIGASLEHRDETQGSLLLEAMAAARRDPELAAVIAEGLGAREQLMTSLVRHSQRAGDIAGDVGPEALARFCTLVVLGALVARVLDLPTTDPTDWSRLIARLVDGFRPEENPTP
jgi:AcrR family transcriptional regulator